MNRITNFNKTVLTHIKAKDMNSLKMLLNSTSDVDVLEMIMDLSHENQAIVYRLLSKDKALFVFERLDTHNQQNLIRSFAEDAAIEIITALEPDERVRLFDEMPATFVQKMLSALSANERDMTNLLMGYKPQTAGRIMTPEYVRVSRNMSVAEALEKVKAHASDKDMVYTVYVTDDTRKLEGIISLRDLLLADQSAKVEKVMQKADARVSTDTAQEEAARLLHRLDWLAVPVVDKENRLVGIMTVDDAVDILEEEVTEDIFDAAGVIGKEKERSVGLLRVPIWKAIWRRLPILLLTLIGGFVAGLIIEGFEHVLESVVAVAFFLPMIMDMGGDLGTQSSTIFARGVALGHINTKKFGRMFLREVVTGFLMGTIVGTAGAIIVGFWFFPALGLAVGFSLLTTMTVAATLGFSVPWALMKLKIDQAAGSAPIITDIKDITGILIYFTFVSIFLSAML